MTEKIITVEVDCTTGEQTERELNAEEVAELLERRAQARADWEAHQAELAAKTEAKASALAKLAALGLTEEEAAAIAGA